MLPARKKSSKHGLDFCIYILIPFDFPQFSRFSTWLRIISCTPILLSTAARCSHALLRSHPTPPAAADLRNARGAMAVLRRRGVGCWGGLLRTSDRMRRCNNFMVHRVVFGVVLTLNCRKLRIQSPSVIYQGCMKSFWVIWNMKYHLRLD